jgi:hypothetical protein
MVTSHPEAQRDRNHRLTQQKTIYHTPVKRLARQQWTGAVLEHGVRVRFRRDFSSFQTAFRRHVARNFAQPKFTGSMSTVSVTSSGNVSVPTIFANVWLNLLIARVRSMIWWR